MPRETSSSVSPKRRAWRIVIGYNLPFVLWTMYAGLRALVPLAGWSCPVQATFHACPGCGLTRAYTDLLTGGGLSNLWLACILAGFAGNAVASICKVSRVGIAHQWFSTK